MQISTCVVCDHSVRFLTFLGSVYIGTSMQSGFAPLVSTRNASAVLSVSYSQWDNQAGMERHDMIIERFQRPIKVFCSFITIKKLVPSCAYRDISVENCLINCNVCINDFMQIVILKKSGQISENPTGFWADFWKFGRSFLKIRAGSEQIFEHPARFLWKFSQIVFENLTGFWPGSDNPDEVLEIQPEFFENLVGFWVDFRKSSRFLSEVWKIRLDSGRIFFFENPPGIFW